ncbi:MAG: hypothetical protein ACP5QG_01625 [candidate division WOR-3 bacterium]
MKRIIEWILWMTALVGALRAAAPVHHSASSFSRPGWKDIPFYPNAAGGGWVSPQAIATSVEDETYPKIAVDGSGNLWCALQSSASYNGGYGTIEIYRSTNNGADWLLQAYISMDFAYLSDPAMTIDVASGRMFMAFLVKFDWASDYDLAWATYDIQADTLANFQTGWLESSSDAISGSPAVTTEKGYAANYAFVAWSQNRRVGATYYFTVKLASTSDGGFTWNTMTLKEDTNKYLGQVCAAAGDSLYPAVMIGFKRNASNMVGDSAKLACLAVSYDRGFSWTITEKDFSPHYVHQISIARAFGSGYTLFAIQVAKTASNSDIYIRYYGDNGSSLIAEYYLEESVSLDSRMPVVAVDAMQYNDRASTYFYIATYRGTPGAANGNCLFKMAWVSSATAASAWLAPKGSDSLVIGNLKAFSVDIANRGYLSMTSVNDAPAIVWCHEYGASDHDIYFANTTDPAHDNLAENPANAGCVLLRNPVNRGLLLFLVPNDMAGAEICFYSPDGRLAARRPLCPELDPGLPSGVYLWLAGSFTGKTAIQR